MKKNEIPLTLVVLMTTFYAVFFSACQSPGAVQKQSPNEGNKRAKIQTDINAEIWLNNERMGTTKDTSLLFDTLSRVFRERQENGVFRENSNEVEQTVCLLAEKSLKVSEAAPVIKALENSGASPLLLPVVTSEEEPLPTIEESKKTAKQNRNTATPLSVPKPNPLLLVVRLITPGFGTRVPKMPLDNGGIRLDLDETPVPRSELVPPPTLFEVQIKKEGEYLVDGNLVQKENLEKTFTDLKKDSWDKEMDAFTVYLEKPDEISFGSVVEVAEIAYRAGVKEMLLRVYTPENKNQ